MTPRRPVMRYHGGKWRIAPWIISHFPVHEIYVEPYGGAGSVLMRKDRSEAEIYNDLDDDVVNVFRVLRNPEQAQRLEELIALTPFSRTEFLDTYKPAADPVERARQIIARSFMAHGTTSRRLGYTGFRSKCWAQRRNEADTWSEFHEHILVYADRMKGVVVENRPAIEVILQHDSPETLFYVDPPYVVSTRTGIRTEAEATDGWRNYIHNLTDEEHEHLLTTLQEAEGMVVLSGYHSELYDDVLAEWESVSRSVRADGGGDRTEVLWLSPVVSERLAAAGQMELAL